MPQISWIVEDLAEGKQHYFGLENMYFFDSASLNLSQREIQLNSILRRANFP
jgi:hypothetical protein